MICCYCVVVIYCAGVRPGTCTPTKTCRGTSDTGVATMPTPKRRSARLTQTGQAMMAEGQRSRVSGALVAVDDNIEILSDQLLVSIAAFLGIRDLGRLSCVATRFATKCIASPAEEGVAVPPLTIADAAAKLARVPGRSAGGAGQTSRGCACWRRCCRVRYGRGIRRPATR